MFDCVVVFGGFVGCVGGFGFVVRFFDIEFLGLVVVLCLFGVWCFCVRCVVVSLAFVGLLVLCVAYVVDWVC